jgi:hypothetical protein
MVIRPSVLTLVLSLAAATCVDVGWHIGTLSHWDWQAAYLDALMCAFVFWNSVRILADVPTLLLLLKPGASADHYSIATWTSWVSSNATLALYLFEAGGSTMNTLVLLNTGNALMRFVTCALIVRLRWRNRHAAKASPQGDLNSARPTGNRPNATDGGDLKTRQGRSQPLFTVSNCGRTDTAASPPRRTDTVALALHPRSFAPRRVFAREIQ